VAEQEKAINAVLKICSELSKHGADEGTMRALRYVLKYVSKPSTLNPPQGGRGEGGFAVY